MTRRKRKLSSTSSDRLARRNLTSTSPLLTREDEVEAIVDVAVVAVERDADVEAAVVVMVKDVHPTGQNGKDLSILHATWMQMFYRMTIFTYMNYRERREGEEGERRPPREPREPRPDGEEGQQQPRYHLDHVCLGKWKCKH